MCYVFLCYVSRILGFEELVTTNAQARILGIGPKFELSTLRLTSQILD